MEQKKFFFIEIFLVFFKTGFSALFLILIKSLSNVLLQGTDDWVWIGLTDFLEEGVFQWFTTSAEPNPPYWNDHEPEDKNHEEDCAGIHGDGWFDTNCEDYHNRFICEIQ